MCRRGLTITYSVLLNETIYSTRRQHPYVDLKSAFLEDCGITTNELMEVEYCILSWYFEDKLVGEEIHLGKL